MRLTAAVKRRVPFRSDIRTTSLPAPTGGWDAISALASMPPDRAVVLDNFIPRPGYIEPRQGFIEWSTGMGSTTPVESVLIYYAKNPANNKMFSVAGTTIYDSTSSGAATPTSVTTLSSARCQYVNFTNGAGDHFLVVCNGVNTPLIYDGSTWATMTITGAVTPENLIQPYSYQSRLFFVEIDSLSAWYLDVNAISGVALPVPFGAFAGLGGYLNEICSWSVDTRQTVNDYIAFITSRGQVLVYTGTDPSSEAAWALVGLYNLGRPLGRRCALKVGGDLAIITVDGVTSMNSVLVSDRTGAKRTSITENILNAVNNATSLYHDNFGWQFISFDHDSLGFLNIPISTNDAQMQFVRNNLTGAWCRFLGINANVWELFEDSLYFGGNDGVLYLYEYDASDNGEPIVCTVHGAWNYLGTRGYSKRFTMMRPVLTTAGQVIPGTGINVNFGEGGAISVPTAATGSGPLWDVAKWDEAIWPIENFNQADWITVSGIGNCVSVIVTVSTADTGSSEGVTLRLNSFDLMYEMGGPLG